jgi:allatostatin receptor
MMLCAPAIFLHREHVYEVRGEQFSVCQFNSEEFNSALYQLCFFMFSFVIPITLIFILYVLMLQRLWFGNVPGGQMSNESVRSKVRRRNF